jgi:hypothetical protein
MVIFSVMHCLNRVRRQQEESFILKELVASALQAATAVGSSTRVNRFEYPGICKSAKHLNDNRNTVHPS